MLKFYLHIGTHKTGSTAIQRALEDKTKLLAHENIICLPMFPQARAFTYIEQADNDIIRGCREYLQSEISKHPAGEETRMVMSYEGFSGNPYAGYDNASLIAPMLKAIMEGVDTRIVIYLRRQDAFIESLYTQSTHRGQSASFDEFLVRIKDASYDWYRLIDSYAQCFGKDRIIVRLYDRRTLTGSNSLLESFAEIIGSSHLTEGDTPYVVNPGYSRQATELARSVNPHLSYKEKKKLRFILQSTMAKKPLEEYTYFEGASRRALLDRYADSNARVAREYVGDASGELFSPPETGIDTMEAPSGQAQKASDESQARALFSRLSARSRLLLFIRQMQRIGRQIRRHLARSAS
jgi:hypothetical protein